MEEFTAEAEFCRLLRKWFEAEDETSIPAVGRCRRRMDLRQWLLKDYKIGTFPPPTRYVRGIPIITFEGLVTHIGRKIQLYSFVPKEMYNV